MPYDASIYIYIYIMPLVDMMHPALQCKKGGSQEARPKETDPLYPWRVQSHGLARVAQALKCPVWYSCSKFPCWVHG